MSPMDDVASQSARPSRREVASEERLEVLRLLEQGGITAEEAARLLDALDSSMVWAPKKWLSAKKSSINHEVTNSGRNSACTPSLSAV